MLRRTHLAIGFSLMLYFLPLVRHRFIFSFVILVSSLLPDIDSVSSSIGRKKIFRPVQWLFVHRGPLHSYSFCVLVSLFFAFYYPIFAFPFFTGYSFHLLADSFTPRGIKPFFPMKFVSKGVVRTGGAIDRFIFFTFVIINIFLFIMLFV